MGILSNLKSSTMLLDLSNDFDVNKAKSYLDKLIESKARCELKKVKEKRTIRQNSYPHVCLGLFCSETGYTIDEAKELFSHQLPDIMRYTKNEISFRKSTADLDTKQMTLLIDKIREMSLDQLGLYITTSEEYLMNLEVDRKDSNKSPTKGLIN